MQQGYAHAVATLDTIESGPLARMRVR